MVEGTRGCVLIHAHLGTQSVRLVIAYQHLFQHSSLGGIAIYQTLLSLAHAFTRARILWLREASALCVRARGRIARRKRTGSIRAANNGAGREETEGGQRESGHHRQARLNATPVLCQWLFDPCSGLIGRCWATVSHPPFHAHTHTNTHPSQYRTKVLQWNP